MSSPLLSTLENRGSLIESREYALIQRGFEKQRAHLAAVYIDGLDPAEEWLNDNKYKTVGQLQVDLQRGPIPSTAEYAEKIWARNGVTGLKPPEDTMQAEIMADRRLRRSSQSEVPMHVHFERGGRFSEYIHPALRTQTGHQTQQPQPGLVRRIADRLFQESQGRYRGFTGAQYLPAQAYQRMGSESLAEDTQLHQSDLITRSSRPAERGQPQQLPAGWEHRTSSLLTGSSPYYFNANDGTIHRNIPAPPEKLELDQLEPDMQTERLRQRSTARHWEWARTREVARESENRERGPDLSSNHAGSISNGNFGGIFGQHGRAFGGAVDPVPGSGLPIATNGPQGPVFLSRVYIGTSGNTRLPIYATIENGRVVYHRAEWTGFSWNFAATELENIEILPGVEQFLRNRNGTMDRLSIRDYVAGRLDDRAR